METLEKNINVFFSGLNDFSKKWSNEARKSVSVFGGLKNQSEQLRLLNKCNWPPDLLKIFPDINKKLLAKVYNGLEEELSQLTAIRDELSSMKDELCSRLEQIERSAYRLDLTSNFIFGEVGPPVYKFIEEAENVVRIYVALFIDIESALTCLEYKDSTSIESVEAAFSRSTESWKDIEEIFKRPKIERDIDNSFS